VVAATGNIQTVAGNGTFGFSGDGGPAINATLHSPTGVFVDRFGNIFIADTGNSRVREVVAATGNIQTVAGNGTFGFSGDGGPAISAALSGPEGVFLDSSGNIFIADSGNQRIREVAAATGNIQTMAGNGTFGFGGDGGPATNATFFDPSDLSVDCSGNIFIADSGNQRIREVVAATGFIQTVAGNGTFGFSGDGGPATNAELAQPTGVYVDSSGNLFIVDTYNSRIREVVAATGIIQTVAGNGTFGFSGDGGPATSAELDLRVGFSNGITGDRHGNLLIAEESNSRIRRISGLVAVDGITVGPTSPP
jgi:sugar lactone lactonase YvrE